MTDAFESHMQFRAKHEDELTAVLLDHFPGVNIVKDFIADQSKAGAKRRPRPPAPLLFPTAQAFCPPPLRHSPHNGCALGVVLRRGNTP